MQEQRELRLAQLADKMIEGTIATHEESEFVELYKLLREPESIELGFAF